MAHSTTPNGFIRVDKTIVDYAGMRVKRNGQWHKVESKQLQLLQLLIANQGSAITRDELLDKIWPNVIVSDNSLSKLVTELRKTLGDSRSGQGIIRTVPRVGYQLISNVETVKNHSLPIDQKVLAIVSLCALVVGGLSTLMLLNLNQNEPLDKRYNVNYLTHQAGLERGASFSKNGQYLVYDLTAKGKNNADLVVVDWHKQTTHFIKTANYDEHSGVFSPNTQWLAYIRADAINCDIRVISTTNAVETWRLSIDSKLADCPNNVLQAKLFWPRDNFIYAQFDDQLIKHDITYEPFPRAHIDAQTLTSGIRKVAFSDSSMRTILNDGKTLVNYDLAGNELKRITLSSNHFSALAYDNDVMWLASERLEQYISGNPSGHLRFDKGLVTDISVKPETSSLVIAKTVQDIALYRFSELNDSLSLVSSLSTDSYLPTVSAQGDKYAYITRNYTANNFTIWQNVYGQSQKVIEFTSDKLPHMMRFSPNGNFLLVAQLDSDINIIDLATKNKLTIANGQLDSVRWHEKSEGVFYDLISQDGAEHWYYNLTDGKAELVSDPFPLEYLLASKEKRALLGTGHQELVTFVEQYLSQRIFDPLLLDNLSISLRLFTPSIYQNGILFVVKKGGQLNLFNFDFTTESYRKVASLNENGYSPNMRLTVSSDLMGKVIMLNQVANKESDLIFLTENQ